MKSPEDLAVLIDLYDELYWMPEKSAQQDDQGHQEVAQVKSVPCLIYVDETPGTTEELLLKNILKAVQINFDDVVILTPNGKDANRFSSIRMLHFSATNAEERYRIHQVGNSAHLYAHTLEAIQTDVQLKRQLWEALQVFFGV